MRSVVVSIVDNQDRGLLHCNCAQLRRRSISYVHTTVLSTQMRNHSQEGTDEACARHAQQAHMPLPCAGSIPQRHESCEQGREVHR